MTHQDQPKSQPVPPPRIVRYRCPNCGQLYFCDSESEPPDICQYCRDMTTWQRLGDER